MGSARWDPSDWRAHKSHTRTLSSHDIFTRGSMSSALDPSSITMRESVDSVENPNSTPIIVAVDVTGSMGKLAGVIIKEGLGTIMEEIYDRKPVTDPHLLCAAVGDVYCDHAPIQVTQFEASIVLAEQVKDLFIEHGGGVNDGESYNAVWYFAAMKTKCDSLIKRGKKGYLFTIGDEPPLDILPKEAITRFFGDGAQKDMTSKELLDNVSQSFEVFHLLVEPKMNAIKRWNDLLGQRAIHVSDYTKLAEVIVSTIQVIEGADADAVAHSWSGDTSLVVAEAVGSLTKRDAAAGGVVRM